MARRSLAVLILAGLLAAVGPLGQAMAQTDPPAEPAEDATADPAADLAAATPEALVEQLNGVLLEAMRNADALGYQGRYDLMRPTLTQTFNFPVMAQITAGTGRWRDFTQDQRQRLVESFSRMSIATFASRFDGYGGEQFEVVDAQPQRNDRILVRSRLVRTDGQPPVELNYLFQEFSGGWRVLDVYLDGIYSELSRQRSEYAAILSNGGVEALIREIDAVTQRLAGGA